nr:uncharacterized protein LOC106687353 [Halyomorpha halys]
MLGRMKLLIVFPLLSTMFVANIIGSAVVTSENSSGKIQIRSHVPPNHNLNISNIVVVDIYVLFGKKCPTGRCCHIEWVCCDNNIFCCKEKWKVPTVPCEGLRL